MMEDQTTIDDNISVRSGSAGGRSPPSLSPAVSVPTTSCSPPPPLLSATQMTIPSPQGHTPPIFPSPPPASRPPFLPALYFSHAYSSPPQIQTSDPTANDCKLIDLRGQKVAAFVVNGDSMLCLPQAFELFLKNLVGGLHTVYTKLKRLGIEPVVCNVEQVRVLRGLGAIQPGVNRCKLLSAKHFEILYKDCTTARRDRLSSLLHDRPGRPPKRPHEIMGMGIPSHLHHGGLPPHPLSPETLMALKKSRLDRDFSQFVNGGAVSHAETEIEKSPLLSNGYNAPPKALMAQYMALNGSIPHPALFAHSGLPLPHHPSTPWQHPQDHSFKGPATQDNIRTAMWENCRASYDEFIKNLERIREERNKAGRIPTPLNEREELIDKSPLRHNGYDDQDVLNLSKPELRDDMSDIPANTSDCSRERDEEKDNLTDNEDFDKIDLSDHDDYNEYASKSQQVIDTLSNNNNFSIANNNSVLGNGSSLNKGIVDSLAQTTPTSSHPLLINSTEAKLPTSLIGIGINMMANNLVAAETDVDRIDSPPTTSSTPLELSSTQPLSSLETLLSNIQNLLKVAAESVRHEEKQWHREKEQLRQDFLRQKEKLERQLAEDEKLKVLYLRKLKKEKKVRRRLEEQLSDKIKRISQFENNPKDVLCLRTDKSGAVSIASSTPNVITSNCVQSSRNFSTMSDSRLSPQTEVEPFTSKSQSDSTSSLYFNKTMLFNCSV